MRMQEAGEDFTTFFGLADQVYAKASVRPQNRVGLWLGAGIMLEYDYEEARTLLRDNLAAAETKLVRVRGGALAALRFDAPVRVASHVLTAPRAGPQAPMPIDPLPRCALPHILPFAPSLLAYRPLTPLQAHFIEDLAFLRDQVITTEVNMARVFNHDVKVRRATGKAGPGASGGAGAPALIEAR